MATRFTRRIIAYVIDFFVVSAIMWIISFLLSFVLNSSSLAVVYKYVVYIVPILIYVYFVVCETFKGASIGKAIMYLEVRSFNGARITLIQALVRNLTKIYWFPIIFDWLIGRFLRRDRLFNLITKTTVVNAS